MSTNQLKVVLFSQKSSNQVWDFLKFLANKKGWNWEFEQQTFSGAESLQGYDASLMDLDYSEEVLNLLTTFPSQVKTLRCVDGLFKEGEAMMPRLVSHEALRKFLVHCAKDVDIREPAFIVGDSAIIRVVGAVLSDMGYRSIYLVGDVQKLRVEKDVLKRSQFGVEYSIVLPENLTLQSANASLLVNVASVDEVSDYLSDLSYFNYMKPRGFVLDLNPVAEENPLLVEAEDAQLQVLPRKIFLHFLVQQWLAKLPESTYHLSVQEIEEVFEEFLS